MDMTKKKHSATAATAETTTETAARDASPEKETVERREQVSQLLSRIDDLAINHSFLSATEQDVASHLADLRSLAAARGLELSADRDAAEKEVRSLSEALKQADEKLNLAAREKEEIENRLDSAVSERDSIRKDADRKLMLVEETLKQLQIMIGELLLLLESKEEALQFLVREKNAIEVKLEEQQVEVELESLVAEKEVFEVKISALEERHRCLVEKNQRLQCEVHSLKDEAEHERLLMEFSFLEKEKDSIQKALRLEKELKKIEDVISNLKSQVEELKKIEDVKEQLDLKKIEDVKEQLDLKKIEDVKEQELLDPKTNSQEVGEEQKKGSVWIWLYPVITTVLATTISFALATLSC